MLPYYEQDGITIYNGNAEHILDSFSSKQFDLCLTDPPYGIDYKYDGYEDTEDNLLKLINNTFGKILSSSKRVAVFSGVNNIWKYPKADWTVSYSWDTTATYGALGYNQWQPILFYGKDIKGFGSVNGIIKSDSIKLSGGAEIGFLRTDKNLEHPCPKPLNIMKILIARFTNEGDLVIDPFAGAGTTLLAAKRLGRKAVGIEQSRAYCDIAIKRLSQMELF